MVSMANPHLAGLAVALSAENWSGHLTVRSALDGGVTNDGVPRYRELASQHLNTLDVAQPEAETIFLHSRTRQSLLHVAEAARTRCYRDGLIQRCYLGIETRANVLHFDPVLPDTLDRIKVQVRYRRQMLDVEVTHEVLRISSRSFTVAPITIAYRGHFRDVASGDTYTFRLLKPQERNRDENRDRRSSPR